MSRSLNFEGLRLHAVTQPRVGISGSPGRSCLYLPLGAVMLHIFFSSALKGRMEEQYLWRGRVRVTAGENGHLETTMRTFPGEQKLFPTPTFPGVAIDNTHGPAATSIYCLGRAREGLIPPPLISSLPFLLHLFPLGFPLWLNFWHVGMFNNKTDNSWEMIFIKSTALFFFTFLKTLRENLELPTFF